MIPYAIRADEWSSYHYLIGMTENGVFLNFRISMIQNLRASSRKIPLSETDRKNLEKKILTNGIQFLSGTAEPIIVRLTPAGQNLYSTIMHLRPHYKEYHPETGIYEFCCTPLQARYYFFRFGKEAEILAPESLRNIFEQAHQEAAELYQNQKS